MVESLRYTDITVICFLKERFDRTMNPVRLKTTEKT